MAEEKVKESVPVAEGEQVRKQVEQQNKLYLSPKHYAAYILSGFGDTNWNSFSGRLFFFATTFLNISPKTWAAANTVTMLPMRLIMLFQGLLLTEQEPVGAECARIFF